MNTADSEEMAQPLKARGFVATPHRAKVSDTHPKPQLARMILP